MSTETEDESDAVAVTRLQHVLEGVVAKAVAAERERCAKMVEELRATWFHDGIPGDLAVPAGAFARSMKELAAVMRDPNVTHAKTR